MSNDGINPGDPLANLSYWFSPNPGTTPTGQQGASTTPQYSLGGDSQSTNSGTNSIYSLESSLLNIVNQQAPLNNVGDQVDLSPFLDLLKQTTDGHAGQGALENDLKNFLAGEDTKSEQSGNQLSSDEFSADIQSFLNSEKEKYKDQG